MVAGTRAAMFAPVSDLGLVVLWDDGDDLHAEPRAPYPHAREVLALRAHRTGAAVLIGGFARTAESTSLVASGWARPVVADRAVLPRPRPAVRAAGGDTELARDEAAQTARLPSLVLRTARDGPGQRAGAGPGAAPRLRGGPRLRPCRERARCAACGGPLGLASAGAAPLCDWCGAPTAVALPTLRVWLGPRPGHRGGRTAEELGRAFPGFPLLTSGGRPDPGRARSARAGRGHARGGAAGGRRLRRRAAAGWLGAARPAQPAGGRGSAAPLVNAAALAAPAARTAAGWWWSRTQAIPAVQALIRWDPVTHAERELGERAELRFPPAVRIASLSGPQDAVEALLAVTDLPPGAELLGPVEEPPDSCPDAGACAQVRGR